MSGTQVKRRGDTAAVLAETVIAEREIAIDTTNWTVRIGDGATEGGHPLARLSDVSAGGLGSLAEVIKTDNYTVATSDAGKMLVANKATPITFALPAVAASASEAYLVRNIGAGLLTIDPNLAEQIEGTATLALATGRSALVWPNAGKTGWRAAVWLSRAPLATDVAFDNSIADLGADPATAQSAIDELALRTTIGPNDWINGNFDIFQIGPAMAASAAIAGYQADFFGHRGVGSKVLVEQKRHPLGQTDVPGNPRNFVRCTVESVSGVSNLAVMAADIDHVTRYAGSRCTLSFWAKADANRDICLERDQYFGTGGSPSAPEWGGPPVTISLTTSWQRFDLSLEWPSVAGKTIGTSETDTDRIGIVFWLDAGSNWNARTNSLGQQSGVFDFSHISIRHDPNQLVQHLADPYGPYNEELELQKCMTLRQVFTTGSLIWSGYVESDKNRWLGLSFKPTLRRVPVITFSNVSALGFGTTLVASTPDRTGVQVTNTGTSTINTGWFMGNMLADANHPYTP